VLHADVFRQFCNTVLLRLQPFYGPLNLSRITRVNEYQKGKTNLDFTEARDSKWHCNYSGYSNFSIFGTKSKLHYPQLNNTRVSHMMGSHIRSIGSLDHLAWLRDEESELPSML